YFRSYIETNFEYPSLGGRDNSRDFSDFVLIKLPVQKLNLRERFRATGKNERGVEVRNSPLTELEVFVSF
ncbi:hypothetical protein GWI33_009295, partial [Rhynchophorus ferrugineus]